MNRKTCKEFTITFLSHFNFEFSMIFSPATWRQSTCGAIILFSLSSLASGQDKPSITLRGAIDDSVVTIRYKLPAKAFLELAVFNRQGYLVDIPLSAEVDAVEDSIDLNVAQYSTGSYVIQAKLNHSPAPVAMKQLRHARIGEPVTYTREEVALHNTLPACDNALCPVGDLVKYDEFFEKYPHYLDKGEVLQRALLAYVKHDKDSLLIAKTIDSLVTYLPSFWSYYTIARYLINNQKLTSLGSAYLVKARNELVNIPRMVRDEYADKIDSLKQLLH